MMFGSISVSSVRFQNDISTRSTWRRPCRRTSPFGTVFRAVDLVEQRAAASARRRRRRCVASASRAPKFAASRTIASAASALRPCSRASSRDVRRRVVDHLACGGPSRCPRRVAEIGVEEPMFVCGAIASMSAAWPITAPAESALEPAARRRRSTGTFEREHRLDDLAHRASRARPACPSRSRPRRSRRPPPRCISILEVVLGDRVDVVVELDDEHARVAAAAAGSASDEDGAGPRPGAEHSRERAFTTIRLYQTRIAASHGGKDSYQGRADPCRRSGVAPCARRDSIAMPRSPRRSSPRSLAARRRPRPALHDRSRSSVPLAGERLAGSPRPPEAVRRSSGSTGGLGRRQLRTRSLGRRVVALAAGRAPRRGRPGRRSAEARAARGWHVGSPPGSGRRDRPPGPDARPGHARACADRPQPGAPGCRLAHGRRRRSAARRPARRRGRRTSRSSRRSRATPTRSASRSSTTRPGRTTTRALAGAGDRAGNPGLPREGQRLERHRLQLRSSTASARSTRAATAGSTGTSSARTRAGSTPARSGSR